MRKFLLLLFCCFFIQNVLAQDHDYIIKKGNDITYCDMKRITNKKIFFIYKNNQKLYNKLTDVIGYKQNDKEFVTNNYRMYDQKDSINPKTNNFKNNIIKGMIIPALLYNSISLGYERVFSNHSSTEIVLRAYVFGLVITTFYAGGLLGYKYHFFNITNHKSNLTFEIYLQDFYYEHNAEGDLTKSNVIGLGLCFTRKQNLSKNGRLILEFGAGCSYNYRKEISYYGGYSNYFYFSNHSNLPNYLWIPRIVFLLEYKI